MAVLRDHALFLRRFPYGESSVVAHVFTRQHGQVHLLAKGAYRPTSRYFAVLDFFDTLDLELDRSPRRELDLLRAGALVTRRQHVATRLATYDAALAVLELIDLVSRPGQPESWLFDAGERALCELERESRVPDFVRVVFALSVLQNLGLAPAVERCAACGREPGTSARDRTRAVFSASAGGRLCARCGDEVRRSGRRVGTLPCEVLLDAAALLRDDPLPLAPERLAQLRDFVERFMEYHLETRPKSHRRRLVATAAPSRKASSA